MDSYRWYYDVFVCWFVSRSTFLVKVLSTVEPMDGRLCPDLSSIRLCLVGPKDDEDHQEKTFSQVYDQFPEGWTPLDVLKQTELRERLGRIQQHSS